MLGSSGRRALMVLAGTLAVGTAGASVAWASPTSPNDPFFPRQWNLIQVGAPAAWTRSEGSGVIIGVVDTGVDLQQEDLAGKVVASTNCVGSGGQVQACQGSGQDDNGHGTHVAGIAAADTDNGRGVAGMAPGARLVVAKALDSQGSGNFDDVNAGIEWVVNHGARIVNLSLGSDLPGLGSLVGGNLSTGVDYAWSHGAIPVIAAGNENFFGLGSSNYGNVNAVVVGATGPDGSVAPYSSPLGNAKWALVAPGGYGTDAQGDASCDGPAQPDCIISTWWSASNPTNEYAYDQGTSMATPMVSGTLALLLAQGDSPSQAVQVLLATADKSVPCGSGCAGRLDAARAVGAAAVQAGGTNPTTPTTAASGTGHPAATTATSVPAAAALPTGPATSPGGGVGAGVGPSLPILAEATPTTAPPAAPIGGGAGGGVPATARRPGRDRSGASSAPYVAGGVAAILLLAVAGVTGRLRGVGARSRPSHR
jgi:subtilisin family serine protease